ncbi:unnamed protein product [Sympodiomycopsis kandeliae]
MVWYPPSRQQTTGGGTPMASIPSGPGVNYNSNNQSNFSNMSNGAGSYHGAATSGANGPGNQAGGVQSEAMNGLVYPALHLHPLNDTFAPKQISLAPPGPHNRVKIGRQTNVKTMPHPSNGYFDSKVLSRMHAEVWCQDGKMFIRDVKSSNGTFINGERLSPEGQESEVFELHSEDVVEFGIDIVSDDSKTIVHHKVAGRVYLVMTAEDALGIRNDFANVYRGGNNNNNNNNANQGGPLGGPGMGPGAEGGLRRGKSSMSFDHIIGRLQMEVQRSREQGQEISNLSNTINEIQESLGGGIAPGAEAPYQHMVPPIHQEDGKVTDGAGRDGTASEASNQAVTALQAQLTETQSSITTHVEKIRVLEATLAEQALLKAEVGSIKSQMEEASRQLREMASSRGAGAGAGTAPTLSQLKARDGPNGHAHETDEDDFDDGASMFSNATITPGADEGSAPRGTDEIESEALAKGGHVGPLAPPDLPPELAARDAASAAAAAQEGASEAAKSASSLGTNAEEQLQAQNRALGTRLEALELKLEEALSFGRTLQSQHVLATETVKSLESRVESLEAQLRSQSTSHEDIISKALEGRFSQWKEQIEAGWKAERKGWEEERDKLKQVIQAWDVANGKLEEQAAHQIALGEGTTDDPHSSTHIAEGRQRRTSTGAATPSGASSSTSSSRRRASKSAKRRQVKRHMNATLRSLLYTASHNDPLEDDTIYSSEEDEASGRAQRSRGISDINGTGPLDDSFGAGAVSGSNRDGQSGAKDKSGSGINMSDWLGQRPANQQHNVPSHHRNKRAGYAFEQAGHNIPALSAIAVLIGVAAWAAMGREGAAGR